MGDLVKPVIRWGWVFMFLGDGDLFLLWFWAKVSVVLVMATAKVMLDINFSAIVHIWGSKVPNYYVKTVKVGDFTPIQYSSQLVELLAALVGEVGLSYDLGPEARLEVQHVNAIHSKLVWRMGFSSRF